jgi:hypothetical protein
MKFMKINGKSMKYHERPKPKAHWGKPKAHWGKPKAHWGKPKAHWA